MWDFFLRLRYGKQYGYEVLFKNQPAHVQGKAGVIIAELGMPEAYDFAFYSRFMEHVFEYSLPPFIRPMVLADKGIGLIDPDNPLARESFKPHNLVDAHGSFRNQEGVPYAECQVEWKPPNRKNPWDHGYFLYKGHGPNGAPDVCDKVGAKVMGWYYGRLIPERKVSCRSQLRAVSDEASTELKKRFPGAELRNAYYMYPETLKQAVDELVAAGCSTIVYLNITCPLYTDFEDYSYALPLLHEYAAGRAQVIMADQLGSQPAMRQAWFHMLRDQLAGLPGGASVLVILSRHGHPFKKETQDVRAPIYREPLEAGVREIMAGWSGKWDVVWSCDEYADDYWDKNHGKFETFAAYRKAIEEKYDYAIELPVEFTAENTDLMIFHAMKKFSAFTEYDRDQPVSYPDWDRPLVRIFREGATTGIYASTPVGPYRCHVVQAVVDSIAQVM